MPKALVNGVNLHYVQVGNARDAGAEHLVMLHGLASNLAFWYFQYAYEFAERFHVTLIDLRGHGASDRTPEGYSQAQLAGDVAGLLTQLGIRSAHFVAHSYGGLVALQLAHRHPHAVRSLVLADSYLPGMGPHAPRPVWKYGKLIQPILNKYHIELDTEDPHFGFHLLGAMAALRVHEQSLPDELRRLFGPALEKFGRRDAERWLTLLRSTTAEADFFESDDLRFEDLRRFHFPILSLYGEGSHAKRSGDELCLIWPHGEFRLVPHAGHFFPLTRAPELIDACHGFWDRAVDHARPVRRPGDRRAYFQSDRFYLEGGAWYCRMRGQTPLGPFATREAAAEELAEAIDQIVS